MKIRINSFISAFALVIIAINLTYSNAHKSPAQPAKPEETVVQVIGRVTRVFDGFGADVGFLVKNGNQLSVVGYDSGSMAAQKGFQPNYINVVKFTNGRVIADPIVVEEFH